MENSVGSGCGVFRWLFRRIGSVGKQILIHLEHFLLFIGEHIHHKIGRIESSERIWTGILRIRRRWAGGIGSGINMKNAVNIGMFPDIPLEKFHYIGNSSLSGAYTMLLSKEAERKTYQVASNMTYLELSTVPTYMDEFVAACFIPHTDTSMFPSVSQQ